MQFPATETQVENCVYGQLIFPKTVHMEVRPTCKIAHERVNWSITFDFGLHDGVDVRTVGRTVGRSVGRSYDDVITKISRMDGLPYFLSNGAPRARSSAINACLIVSIAKTEREPMQYAI